jgi:hypothetical protein
LNDQEDVPEQQKTDEGVADDQETEGGEQQEAEEPPPPPLPTAEQNAETPQDSEIRWFDIEFKNSPGAVIEDNVAPDGQNDYVRGIGGNFWFVLKDRKTGEPLKNFQYSAVSSEGASVPAARGQLTDPDYAGVAQLPSLLLSGDSGTVAPGIAPPEYDPGFRGEFDSTKSYNGVVVVNTGIAVGVFSYQATAVYTADTKIVSSSIVMTSSKVTIVIPERRLPPR